MKERPILFTGAMVRAIREGRKTQTRRLAKFSSIYRLTDERIAAIHSNTEYEIATKADTGISERRLPSGERRQDLLPDALRWIWTQGARGLVCVGRPSKRDGIPHCFFVPQKQEGDKECASAGLYGVSWYASNADTPNQTFERNSNGQPPFESKMGHTGGKLERPPRAWHCNGWGEASGIKIVRRSTGAYSLRRKNGVLFPPPRKSSLGDVTVCYFRNLPWYPGLNLWVKETFRLSTTNDCACYDPCNCKTGAPIYRADSNGDGDGPWKPSIFMPRKLSRITLGIVSIGIEWLQEISADDAEREGVGCGVDDETGGPVARYSRLWDSINGKDSWCSWNGNPYVWKIEFRVI